MGTYNSPGALCSASRLTNAQFAVLGVCWLVAVHLLTLQLSGNRGEQGASRRGFRSENVSGRRRWGERWRTPLRDARKEDDITQVSDGDKNMQPNAQLDNGRGDSFEALLARKESLVGYEGHTGSMPKLRKRDVDEASSAFMRGVGYENLVTDESRDWLYNGRRNPFKGGWSGGGNPKHFTDDVEYRNMVQDVDARKAEASKRRQRWLDLQAQLKRSAYLQLKPFLLRQKFTGAQARTAKRESKQQSMGHRADMLARVAETVLGDTGGGEFVSKHRHAVVVSIDDPSHYAIKRRFRGATARNNNSTTSDADGTADTNTNM